jgi:lysophospholipase L1-like esterase
MQKETETMRFTQRVLMSLALIALTGCGGQGPAIGAGPWLAFGDSITQAAFERPQAPSLPGVQVVGMPGATAAEGVSQIGPALTAHPAARYVALGFGTNDAYRGNTPSSYRAMMKAMAERVRQAGKTPVIARIPFGARGELDDVPAFNQAIVELEAELGLKPGPDLYTHFKAHPEQIQSDGIHMTAEGSQAIQRMWAEVAQALPAAQ